MKARDFVKFMLENIKGVDTEFWVVDDYVKDEVQWISKKESSVNPNEKIVVLKAIIDDSKPDDEYLITLKQLKKWFNENNIKEDFKVIINNAHGTPYHGVSMNGNEPEIILMDPDNI